MGQLIQKNELATAFQKPSVRLFCVAIGILILSGVLSVLFKAEKHVQNILQFAFSATAAVLLLRTSLKFRPILKQKSAGWIFVAAGIGTWSLGQLIWTILETGMNQDPFPSVADIGFLAMYPLVGVGLAKLLADSNQREKFNNLLDAGITASGFAILSWHFIFGALLKNSSSPLEKVVLVSYPLLDLGLLFGSMYLYVSRSSGDRNTWRWLASGVLLLSLADTGFTIFELHELPMAHNWFDYFWSASFILVSCAAIEGWTSFKNFMPDQRLSSIDIGSSKHSPFSAAFPYIAAITATTTVILIEVAQRKALTGSTVFACGLVLLLVFARQFVTLIENQLLAQKVHRESEQNRDLAEELKTLNDNLETMVDTRTRQINAINRLTKSVSSTLDINTVISAAGQTTMEAFQAEGIAIWLHEKGQNESVETRLRFTDGSPHVVLLLKHLPTDASSTDENEFGFGDYFGVLIAPIMWSGLVMGQIAIGTTKRRFVDGDQELLDSIAMEVGTALRHAFLYADAVRRADHDSITELYNHRALQQRLDMLLERCGRDTKNCFVMLFDLNNFKFFNDTYGHTAGDTVLRKVAEAIRAECGSSAFGGRYGGDEFMIVGMCLSVEEPRGLANRIRKRLQNDGYKLEDDERIIPIGASFGISIFPFDGTSRHELTSVADQNLYSAKKQPTGIATSSDSQRVIAEIRGLDDIRGLDGLVTSVDNKDRYTRRHSEDVSEFALWIADELGFDEETKRILRVTALLHDVGKICIPDEILRKPGRLTDEEYEILKSHPHMGAMIVSVMPGMDAYIPGIKHHHERWDGQGYPEGLAGEQIPMMGRLLAVADAFSAMTTDRPYRKGMEWDVAMGLIQSGIGTQFDPTMATAFLNALDKRQDNRMAA